MLCGLVVVGLVFLTLVRGGLVEFFFVDVDFLTLVVGGLVLDFFVVGLSDLEATIADGEALTEMVLPSEVTMIVPA